MMPAISPALPEIAAESRGGTPATPGINAPASLDDCVECGKPLPLYPGHGRPRLRCESCAADKSAIAKAWRDSHRAEDNARRRENYWRARLRTIRRTNA